MNDLSQYIKRKKEHTGYCIECQRPHKYMICTPCYDKLTTNKLYKKITLKDIGLSTINHQQHLHRKMFSCNVLYEYRGKKEDRIRCDKLTEDDINTATNKLTKLLSSKNFTIYNKTHKVKTKHPEVYFILKNSVKNFEKRILYNAILIYLSHYMYDIFENDTHFKYALTSITLNHIERTNIRINRHNQNRILLNKTENSYKYFTNLHNNLDAIVKPILHKLIDSSFS